MMQFFNKIVKWWSDFFRSLKSDNKKQLVELERLEKQIEELQTLEKQPQASAPFTLTSRMSLKFRGIGLFVIFLAYIIFQSLSIIYLVFTAYILSLAMEAIIDFFQKRVRNRGVAIFFAYLLFVIFVLAGCFFVIPFLITQLSSLITMLTANIEHIQVILETQSLSEIVTGAHWIPWSAKETLIRVLSNPDVVAGVQTKLQTNISQIINLWTSYAKDLGNFAVNFVSGFVNFITKASIVATLAVLFSIQKDAVMKFISSLRGEKKYKYVYIKLERIYKKLWIWLKSQLVLCVFIGLALYLWLRILSWCGIDIPSKGSLALIAGITELIPYIGPILGWSLAVLVAFIHFGRVGAIFVLGIVIIIQWLENNILVPVIMNKSLGVNPIVIFISMIIGGLVIGFVGILLAVPIAVIITLMLEKTFEE